MADRFGEEVARIHKRFNLKAKTMLIFDFDGVIANSMGTQHKAWLEALAHVNGGEAVVSAVEATEEKRICENLFLGRAGDQMFEGTILDAKRRKELRQSKNAFFRRYGTEITVFQDTVASLKEMRTYFDMAIASTANKEYVEALLERSALLECFDVITTNGDVGKPKPNPEMLELICAKRFLRPEQCVMIGDTENDREMAEKFGCDIILSNFDGFERSYKGRFQEPVVEHWKELKSRIENICFP